MTEYDVYLVNDLDTGRKDVTREPSVMLSKNIEASEPKYAIRKIIRRKDLKGPSYDIALGNLSEEELKEQFRVYPSGYRSGV